MADVGVRELKQHLSVYLDRAEQGELLRVTDRGRPKALLGPLPGQARVEQGITEGWIRPGSEGRLGPAKRQESGVSVSEALAGDRGE